MKFTIGFEKEDTKKLHKMWGDAGIYSFYATKTISTGEGGMLVSKNKDLINTKWVIQSSM